jgi:bacterioferritin (cytochrome b1)
MEECMEKLAQSHRDKLIDVLNERLTFERIGVQLYDRILGVLARTAGADKLLGEFREHRNEEKEHEEWLEAQIRNLGGTAHEDTERSRLVMEESKGIGDVILRGEERLPHMFHALLAAELVDNAGWDLLVQLAAEAHDHAAKREFKKRLHEEEKHLMLMRKLVIKETSAEVFEGAPSIV